MNPALQRMAGGPPPAPQFDDFLRFWVCPATSHDERAVQTVCAFCEDPIEHARNAPARPAKVCLRCGEIERLKPGGKRQ